jgi:hypothetical protein
MDEQKEKFLNDAFLDLTVRATVQRSKTYRGGAKDTDKAKFREELRKQLTELAQQYSTNMDNDDHIRNIERLADSLSEEFAPVLEGGRFRIGSAQKALNLYLKYLWCAEQIHMPPHCPFDRKIIELLGCNINWTTLDNVESYRHLVETAHAKAKAGNVCLAQWELKTYSGD